MNRKLLNGLLVAAIAAGGVGTFTSCKDEDFRNDVLLEQDSLAAKLEAIRGVSDDVFKANLETWLNGLTESYNTQGWKSYKDLVEASEDMYIVYDAIINKHEIPDSLKPFIEVLYKFIEDNYIKASDWYGQIYTNQTAISNLKKDLEELKASLKNRPSSVMVDRVFNPVFGSINLPVGINSTVLATYYYYGTDAEFSFPGEAYLHLAEATPFSPDGAFAELIAGLSKDENVKLENGKFTAPDEIFGNMGGTVLAINPTINDFVDKYVVELVKTNGESCFSTADKDGCLKLNPFNDELYFGVTRADENTGLYALQVNATDENYKDLYFDLDKSDLKDAFKQLVESKSISSVAHLGEVVFKAVNNKLPAYGVKLSWNEGTDEAPVWNSILSNFDLAATVVHPLSYGAKISAVIPSGKSLPYISPLEEYVEKIQNKLQFEFKDIDGIDYVTLNMTVKVENNTIIFTYTDDEGETVELHAPYYLGEIQIEDWQLQSFVNAILEAANYELAGDLNNQLVNNINKSIADINDQLKQYEGKVGDLQDYLEEIKNSKKLTYANKLVDVYNKLATYANKFLDNPDHYLQVMMAYSAGNGPHHMSPRWYAPTVVDASLGDGFEVYISSHTGDVVVPSYKKYVAITGVVDKDGNVSTSDLADLNKEAGLNKVFEGTQERLAISLPALKALNGKTVRLTYVSVDYRGMCSMENYYLAVK